MSTVFAFHHCKGFQVENTKYFSSITGYLYTAWLSPVVEAVGLGAASAERDKRRLLTLEKKYSVALHGSHHWEGSQGFFIPETEK